MTDGRLLFTQGTESMLRAYSITRKYPSELVPRGRRILFPGETAHAISRGLHYCDVVPSNTGLYRATQASSL